MNAVNVSEIHNNLISVTVILVFSSEKSNNFITTHDSYYNIISHDNEMVELEVFHSLYNLYCPKRISFSYEGMYARTQLAVMDHNSGG